MPPPAIHGRSRLFLVDLIEHAAVAEVLGLRLGPAAEVADRDEIELRELARVLRGDLRIRRAVIVLRDDFLCLVGVQVIQVRLGDLARSEEHTSELQSLMRISYAVFCLKKKK